MLFVEYDSSFVSAVATKCINFMITVLVQFLLLIVRIVLIIFINNLHLYCADYFIVQSRSMQKCNNH
jgi:hypothetical protein